MARSVNPVERSETARAIHSQFDQAAAVINSMHAQVLSGVIKAQTWKIHRDVDGFSALRDWLVSKFDFHHKTAADLAAIARGARKFGVLTAAAVSGAARIDQVAFAVRALGRTAAMRLYATTPYRKPVVSPFDAAVACPTPEHLIAQHCQHAPHTDLARLLGEIEAALKDQEELLEGLSEQSLARLEVWEQDNGMWAVDGLLAADTGALLAKLLTTAVAPPRQGDCEPDTGSGTEASTTSGVEPEAALPPQANRNAEALHQMLASFGTDPHAPKRHGHTATLHLVCDLVTLQGDDTGRLPTLEGRPISLAKARLLACEGQAIPSIFDYTTGEAIELGRTMRLPNAALRRKLELEQPGGCAWTGCGRPVHWTEAHHVRAWWAGGETNADNLILLCRFHHGRIHTPGWTITKTGPGRALIVHHEGHEAAPADLAAESGDCGCADWRTDTDLEAAFTDDASNVFDTGLYPTEWAETLKDDLNQAAEQHETQAAWGAATTARAQARARFTTEATETTEARTPTPASAPEPEPRSGPERDPEPACIATRSDPGPPPFLPRPPREAPAAGASTHTTLQPEPHHTGSGPRRARTRQATPNPPPTPHRRRPGEPRPHAARQPTGDATRLPPHRRRRSNPDHIRPVHSDPALPPRCSSPPGRTLASFGPSVGDWL